MEIAERSHPEHPYEDPRVDTHVDDGRAGDAAEGCTSTAVSGCPAARAHRPAVAHLKEADR